MEGRALRVVLLAAVSILLLLLTGSAGAQQHTVYLFPSVKTAASTESDETTEPAEPAASDPSDTSSGPAKPDETASGNTDGAAAVTAQLQGHSYSVSIHSQSDGEGNAWLFLPASTEGKELRMESGLSGSAAEEITAGGTYVALSGGTSLTILTGSAIPAVYITLQHDLSELQADREQTDSGSILIVSADGTVLYNGELKKISGRGNTSWEEDKKPFNITLGDRVALSEEETPTDTYCLISSTDQTFLRNRISRALAQVAGASSLEAFCVDLYINGYYQGVYELSRRVTAENVGIASSSGGSVPSESEQNEALRRTQRTTGETTDDWNHTVTGKWWESDAAQPDPDSSDVGYLLEADSAIRYGAEASGFVTDSGAAIVSKSPEYLTKSQYEYISGYVQTCEDLMYAGVNSNSLDELSAYIDIDSFVGKYLVEEISKNIDSGTTSQYFFKDSGQALQAGPVWDYDWAYGADREQEGIDYSDPEGFAARELTGSLTWWQLLYYNSAFLGQVKETYGALVYTYLNELTDSVLSEWADGLTDSAVMDLLLWGGAGTQEEARSLYENEVEQVRCFLEKRSQFLYREWVRDISG